MKCLKIISGKELNAGQKLRLAHAIESYNKLPAKTKSELSEVINNLFAKDQTIWQNKILSYIKEKDLVRWEAIALIDIFKDLKPAGKSVLTKLKEK